MAQTIPIYVEGDVTESAALSDGSQTDEAKITTGGGSVASGLLWGVHGELSSTGGQATVRVFTAESGGREIYSVTMDFSGGATQTSDLMSSAIPMFEAPWFTVEGDSTSALKKLKVNFYIQALRF